MKGLKIALVSSIVMFSATLMAGNSFFVNFQVLSEQSDGLMGTLASKNAGVSIVREQFASQVAHQLAGPDGPGVGRIYSKLNQPSYVLTDIGSQFVSSIGANQALLSVIECYQGQFGWDGDAYVAASRSLVDISSVIGGRLIGNSVTLTKVPIPTLVQGASNHIVLQVPPYNDAGGRAQALQLWRQGSDGLWQPLAQLGLTITTQTYTDSTVSSGASYWYGVSVVFSWPGGSGEGALPALAGQYVSEARSISGLMVAAELQPTPTPVPTLPPQVNHDLGQAGWAAGPNPSRDGHFTIQFHSDKAATWQLKAFTLEGSLAKVFRGNVTQAGWQMVAADLFKQASGVYLMELRVTQEGEPEKTLPIRKVAIIR